MSFALASTVFGDPFAKEKFDAEHSDDEPRWVTIGQAYDGQTIVVTHCERGEKTRIIMKKAVRKRRKGVGGTSREYDFSDAVRTERWKRYREQGNVVALDVPPAEPVIVLAPLVNLPWDGGNVVLSETVSIVGNDQHYEGFRYFLSEYQLQECHHIPHWVQLQHVPRVGLSPAEEINTVLLSLWLIRPSETEVPFRFEDSVSGTHVFAYILERFQWNRSQPHKNFTEADFGKVRDVLPAIHDAYRARRRLRNALVLTHRGCVAKDWQSAFICFSAAVEALLTYSTGAGVTERLAKAYATLVARSDSENQEATEKFRRLYAIRSDIMHGRAYDRKRPADNLRNLAEFSGLLRKLWRTILNIPEVVIALEKSDDERRKFFVSDSLSALGPR